MNNKRGKKRRKGFKYKLFFLIKRIIRKVYLICKVLFLLLKRLLQLCENFIIGKLLREIVIWHDKRKGQFVDIKQTRKYNKLLKEKIKAVQEKHSSELRELKTQIGTANKTLCDFESRLKKLNIKIQELAN